MLFEVASNPKESLERKKEVIGFVKDITENREAIYIGEAGFVPIFLKVFELARDPKESLKRANLFKALTEAIGKAERSNMGLLSKERQVSAGSQGEEEALESAADGHSSSSSLSISPNIGFPRKQCVKEAKIIVGHNDKLMSSVQNMTMYDHINVPYCMNKLEEMTINCIQNTLINIKHMLPEIQGQHLPEMQQAAGDNLPSNKFKGILLILKEMMTGIRRQHIRKQHGRAYTTAFLDCVDTKTLEVDVKISDISYRFTENGKSCDDFECLMWLGLSKSLQRMIGLHASVKDEFLSVQLALKTRGGELHLDEESFDSLLYLVACVRQMKNDLKQQVKGFCMKIDFCRMVYEGTNVCHKLDAFYEKQGELVNELASDFNFCRNYSNYNPEVGKAFNMLIEELELEGLGTQLGRMMQQKGSSNR